MKYSSLQNEHCHHISNGQKGLCSKDRNDIRAQYGNQFFSIIIIFQSPFGGLPPKPDRPQTDECQYRHHLCQNSDDNAEIRGNEKGHEEITRILLPKGDDKMPSPPLPVCLPIRKFIQKKEIRCEYPWCKGCNQGRPAISSRLCIIGTQDE